MDEPIRVSRPSLRLVDAPETLDEKQLAPILGFSRKTVQEWRRTRVGPPFRKVGFLIRYRRDEVLAWLNALPRVDTDPMPSPKQPRRLAAVAAAVARETAGHTLEGGAA